MATAVEPSKTRSCPTGDLRAYRCHVNRCSCLFVGDAVWRRCDLLIRRRHLTVWGSEQMTESVYNRLNAVTVREFEFIEFSSVCA